jgi:hypothetical protein
MITAENMDTSGGDIMDTTLVSFMYTIVKVITKSEIRIRIVFDILKSFPDKGSRSTLDQLQLIKDRCMLFKLAKVSEG